MRDPRYDVLFEPVPIGPLVAKNRFFQVPHCNGMGYRDPASHAEMRAVKAEGGWAVVCTEQAEIHHTSEITPFIEARIWDDCDIPALALMAERVHDCGALAGIELAYNGMNGPNLHSRVVPLGPVHLPVATFTADPVQARAMTRRDIADLRRWHRQAVDRALRAGFDLVYVYAGHALGGVHHFLSRRYNLRTDEYGGSLENRMRLLRELLEDTVEEVAGRAAVGCRITVEESAHEHGIDRTEIEAVIGALGELPDLWDFVPGSWEDDSITSRFSAEAHQEEWVRGLKALTSKPVVGVGRFTSPDTMVRMVRQGILDFIGAARPSIADPFLPRKIEQGHPEDIRECIGCNICVSGDFTMSPIRCTQNPVHGRGVATRLAPRALPAPPRRRASAGGRRRPSRPGSGHVTRQTRIRGSAGREIASARGSGRGRGPAAGTGRMDPGSRLPPGPDLAARQRRALPGERHDRRRGPVLRLRPHRGSHRLGMASRRRRPLAHQTRHHAHRHPTDPHTRRCHGRRTPRGQPSGRLRRRPLLHGRHPGRVAESRRLRSRVDHTGGARLRMDGQHDGATPHPSPTHRSRNRAANLHRSLRRARHRDSAPSAPSADKQNRIADRCRSCSSPPACPRTACSKTCSPGNEEWPDQGLRSSPSSSETLSPPAPSPPLYGKVAATPKN